MNITEEDLNRIADDMQAREQLQRVIEKKMEYWDALSDLERYVGLEFPSDRVPNAKITDTDKLRRLLSENFNTDGIVDKTGIIFK